MDSQEYSGWGADDQVHVVLGAVDLGLTGQALCGRTVFRVYARPVATTCAACSLARPQAQPARTTYEPCG